jgi:hypothetical protein
MGAIIGFPSSAMREYRSGQRGNPNPVHGARAVTAVTVNRAIHMPRFGGWVAIL